MKTKVMKMFAASMFLCLSVSSQATLINFEGGSYTDNQTLNTPVELLDSMGNASGVTLTSTAGTMTVEEAGSSDPALGFVNDQLGSEDTDQDANFDLDSYFLRTTAALSTNLNNFNPVFTLNFLNAASTVSGQIWDIDGNNTQGTEAWKLTAFLADSSTTEIFSPVGTNNNAGSLDGKAWEFMFASSIGITSIEFAFVGTKTTGIGVAFDNLEYTAVSAPTTAMILLIGLAYLGVSRRLAV
jgi:hypothetical protein